jgi:hypothetical protein
VNSQAATASPSGLADELLVETSQVLVVTDGLFGVAPGLLEARPVSSNWLLGARSRNESSAPR